MTRRGASRRPSGALGRRLSWRRLLLAASLLGALFLGLLLADVATFLRQPLELPPEGLVLDIPRGTSLRGLAQDLAARGLLERPYYFIALAYQRGDQTRIKAGEYALTPPLTPGSLLSLLISGRVIDYPVTFIEGWTFRQAVAAVDAVAAFTGPLGDLDDATLMRQLGRPGEHPEGRFFPDTYRFARGTARLEIMRRALERMDRILAEEWDARAPNLPLATPYEALILASIIEKETAVPAERTEVSGVFVRRLRRGMRLQTDPTVIYGMGERYEGRIRRADLREATPYNTYVIQGLPPTPIALSGRASIHAALHPADGDALYFVARGDGSHVFSATLDAHNRAVRRYILGQGE